MGWLDINRTHKQLRSYRATLTQQRHKKPRLQAKPTSRNLWDFPQELLEKIFIYSGNLELAFVNRNFYHRLRPSYYLNSQLLLQQSHLETHNGTHTRVLPAGWLLQPFVTRQLLEAVQITRFQPMEIPHKLVVLENTTLLIYLLQCGMTVDSTPACYDVFLRSGETTGIKLLLNLKAVPTKENLIRAIELGNKYASRMASLFEGSQQDVEQVWGLAQGLGKKRVVRVLADKL